MAAATLDAVRAAGCTVEEARPVDLYAARSTTFWLWVASSSSTSDDEQLDRLRQQAYDAGDDSFPALRARAEPMPHRDWLRLDDERQRLLGRWRSFFTDHDVLVCPAQPWTAPRHDPHPDQVASLDHRLARTVETSGGARPTWTC